MNKYLKKGFTVSVGIVFAAVTIGYSFFQPFQPDAVTVAIPVYASSVFKAENLDKLLQSPVRSQIDSALGRNSSLEKLLADNNWTKLAAPSEIAVADILYRDGSKTWVATSWVGWRSPWLRWKLEQVKNESFELLGKHSVWPVWKYKSPDIAHGQSLTLALTDNLLILCLSESPNDIVSILDTYDRGTPSL